MVPRDERTQQALTYVRHQDTESLADLRVLVERTAADCGRCLEGISEKEARFQPGNEWSINEVLDHLIYATARQVTERIRDLAVRRPPRLFTADDSSGRAMQTIEERRQELARLLEDTVVLVSALPAGDLPAGTWEHPFLGPLNLKELIAYHRLHVMDHVQQIEKIKAEPDYPRVRATQLPDEPDHPDPHGGRLHPPTPRPG
jgi:hypothetical protein